MSNIAPPQIKTDFRSDIQGLRGLAVLIVVFFHFDLLGMQGGFLGVDIFFVVSGFLITSIIAKPDFENRFSNLLFFLYKRIWRIFPAYLFVILITLISGFSLFLPSDFSRLGIETLYSLVFVSNFYFAETANYFDVSAMYKPLLHTWSLSVEMQFYLLWVVLLYFSKQHFLFQRVIILTFVISLLASTALSFSDPDAAFYSLPSRLWELSAGALAWCISQQGYRSRSKIGKEMISWMCLGIIICSAFLINQSFVLPSPIAIFPVAATAVLLITGTHNPTTNLILKAPILVWLGEISYSLYLIHWPVAVFLSYSLFPEPSALMRIVALLLCIPFAKALYELIESPMRKIGRSKQTNTKPNFAIVSLASLVLLTSYGIFASNGFPYRLSTNMATALSNLENSKERLTPVTHKIDGDYEAKRTSYIVALWGDSHAGHLTEALRNHMGNNGQSLQVMNSNGCPPIVGAHLKNSTFSLPKKCMKTNYKVLQDILHNNSISTVILAARWTYYAETSRFKLETGSPIFLTHGAWDVVSVDESKKVFAQQLKSTIRALRQKGKKGKKSS